MKEEDKRLIWSLMPEWAKRPQEGLCSTLYGTLSYEGDLRIHRKLVAILGPPDWTAFPASVSVGITKEEWERRPKPDGVIIPTVYIGETDE